MYLRSTVSYWLILAARDPRRPASCCARSSSSTTARTARSCLAAREPLGRAVFGLLVFQPFATGATTTPSITAPPAISTAAAPATCRPDRRGVLRASPGAARLGYRLFRNPLVMFGIGPIWSLMIGAARLGRLEAPAALRHSVLADQPRPRRRRRRDLSRSSAGRTSCWSQMPAAILAGTAGVWLFYVQHQFEDVYWENSEAGATRTRRCAAAPT